MEGLRQSLRIFALKSSSTENPSGLGTFNYNLRFSGQYFDVEKNSSYNYFRDCYDPSTGRYCQSDPIGLDGGINTYAYVENNPLIKFDMFGLQSGTTGSIPPPPNCDNCESSEGGTPYPGPAPEPGLEPVYPELILIPIARGREAAAAVAAAIKKLWETCKNIRCKLAIHDAHHHFGPPFNQKMCHIQLNCWVKGRSGSSFVIRIPYPCGS